jgi:hypothetical protein
MPPQLKIVSRNETRPLYAIAYEIQKHRMDLPMSAWPYLSAMSQLTNSYDLFGVTRGRDIIGSFLANSGKWNTSAAHRIKGELREML